MRVWAAGIALFGPMRAVSAAEGNATVATVEFDEETESFGDIFEAFAAAGLKETSAERRATVKLCADSVIGESLKVESENFISLDLNGYMLRMSGEGSVIEVNNKGDLLLCDSNPESEYVYYVNADGVYVVDDGTAEWDDAYAQAEKTGTIAGGVITGGSGAEVPKQGGFGSYYFGGGVAVHESAALTMQGGTIAGNFVSSWVSQGGGMLNNGSFSMEGGTIAGNAVMAQSNRLGGGVFVTENAGFTMTGGLISENAAFNGGGIYICEGAGGVNLIGSIVDGNEAVGVDAILDEPATGAALYISEGDINIGDVVFGANDIYNYNGTLNITAGEIGSDKIVLYNGKLNIGGGYIGSEIVKELFGTKANITGGYFAKEPDASDLDENHIALMIDADMGDEMYREGFPYAIYGKGEGALRLACESDVVYDGSPVAEGTDFTVEKPEQFLALTYYYKGEDDAEYRKGLPVEAGEYSLKAEYIDAENKAYYSSECELIIAKATPEYSAPSGFICKYGSTLADLYIDGAENGVWSWADGPSTSTGPRGRKSFDAIFTPNDTKNYLTVTVSLEVEVLQADPNVVFPERLSATYGDTLADIELPEVSGESWVWADGEDTSVGEAGVNIFMLTFLPDDIYNYITVSKYVRVEVKQAMPEYSVPEDITATYGFYLSSYKLPSQENGTWVWEADGSAMVGDVGTHTFSVLFIPTDAKNYQTVRAAITVTVVKANATHT